jgi:hypothetical protein
MHLASFLRWIWRAPFHTIVSEVVAWQSRHDVPPIPNPGVFCIASIAPILRASEWPEGLKSSLYTSMFITRTRGHSLQAEKQCDQDGDERDLGFRGVD